MAIQTRQIKKRTDTAFGKTVYLLGYDECGIAYWLEEAKWDCEWYWGGGYVETYTNNLHPHLARDIKSHQHFDGLFFSGKENSFDSFQHFFREHPFSDKEVWQICELMKSFYIARQYSDMLYRGGAHYTDNPAKAVIKEAHEFMRINKSMIPQIMNHLYAILSGTAEATTT